jgi:glycosyltransferase involved in cell wall biosynthesis
MQVALVHDYLTQRGGAERVFELLCKRFPDADIYTSIYDKKQVYEFSERIIRTSFLQSFPNAAKYFRLLAPLYYPAFRSLDLRGYDLIISSTSSFAKGVRKDPQAKHICFCHNVTRFLWDTDTYLREYKEFQRFYPLIKSLFYFMRQVDFAYAQEPDVYIANSTIVADRIQNIYHRPAITINYPIDAEKFFFSNQKEDFYLVSARLLSYKRIDIIIEAFNQLGWLLFITGDGPELRRLKTAAKSNITFLGHVGDTVRRYLLSKAKSVVVAALEDYGLVPIEANVSGTPVIAYGAGGVLDTQIHRKTGLFFQQQNSESLQNALLEASVMQWDYSKIREHALDRFTESTFFEQVDKIVGNVCSEKSLAVAC